MSENLHPEKKDRRETMLDELIVAMRHHHRRRRQVRTAAAWCLLLAVAGGTWIVRAQQVGRPPGFDNTHAHLPLEPPAPRVERVSGDYRTGLVKVIDDDELVLAPVEDAYHAAMRLKSLLLPFLLIASPGGCAKAPGPDLLRIDAGSYHDAFDAAMEASRINGLPLALRDRRGGVIETEPAFAASILEPWRDDNDTLGESLENSIAFQRRRARFEFAPAGTAPPSAAPTADPTTDPDLLGIETRDLDLTAYDGDLELRVLVIVERAHAMGVRRSTWSRSSAACWQPWIKPSGTGPPSDRSPSGGVRARFPLPVASAGVVFSLPAATAAGGFSDNPTEENEQ